MGVGAYALDRAQALVGNPNPTMVGFLAPPTPAYVVGDGLLPSDLDGQTPPPVGSPNYFVGSQDNNGPYGAPSDALNLWKFHYDPMTPGNSTFMLTNTLPTQPFNSILGLCGGTRNCIPQPGTANQIDHLGYRQRPLFRLAYRNFGTTNRWSPISRCLPAQDQTAKCPAFAGGNCAVPIAARSFFRRALMRLGLLMGFIAGWAASP